MTSKKFFKRTVFSMTFIFLLNLILIIIIDPYFHYHKPLKFINYSINGRQERYINNGIVKHFDYDAVITGTSMTENFKSSQFDKLFNINSIKVPFSGGSYKEINDNVEVALKSNKNIKYILRGLDYGKINDDYKTMKYKSYPIYLYDDKISNDDDYWWNKDTIKRIKDILISTIKRKPKITFDEYARWNEEYIPGKESVLKTYKRLDKENIEKNLSKEDIRRIDKNIEENVTRLPREYSNVKFIYFITPYSIVYFDELNQKCEIEKQIMAEKYMIEKILEVPNIELYSFFNNYEMITDLNNYKDAGHYMGHINDQILIWIKEEKYKLTKENYQEYINKNLEFYQNYDYESIFKN